MTTLGQLSADYRRIEAAIRFLEENARQQPSLSETAHAAGLSEYHFQRLFSRWVGISPKRFLQYLTKEYAKRLLREAGSVLGSAWDAGLSGSGRLHDLFVRCEAVTPGQYKTRGRGLSIEYGFHPTPFGEALVAVTGHGICGLKFVQGGGGTEALALWLRSQWPAAELTHCQETTGKTASAVFHFSMENPPAPLHLFVRGTNFQIKVWEALLKIPIGAAVTYSDIARHIGMPGAARAVGTAVGRNPIPFLIPCHRVIRKVGDFGNYGEGPVRKKAIIGWEAAWRHDKEVGDAGVGT